MAVKVLAEPMHAPYAPKQRSYAQVLAPIPVPNLAAPKKKPTIILESESTNKEKLSSAEVKSIK